jgi:3-methyl-2-oxobutanoate hydroxymethyltransferase
MTTKGATMRNTVATIKNKKLKGEKISMLTAYDYSTAKLADEVGVDMLLVGDSLGMVVLGYESTVPVTMEEMLHHTSAVVRGAKQALVVGDLPFMTYQASVEEAMHNSGRMLKEAGAQAVKLEGGRHMAETIRRLVQSGIPVMGHIGLTPQSINTLGGFKVQGKTEQSALDLIADAEALDQAGVFAMVLECVPTPLAKLVTERVSVPTIGIGAGQSCDGQVQVINDILGLSDFVPKHAKQYVRLSEIIADAVKSYVDDVKGGQFPTQQQCFTMDENIIEDLKRQL